MKRSLIAWFGVLVFSLLNVFAQEQESRLSKVVGTPQWEKLKSLVGEWDGYTMGSDKKMPAHISVRMTGDGSALMHVIAAGTPEEMITMFHMNQEELLATHYCAAHNQPRLKALPSKKPDEIPFEFKDGTNIRPGDGFMRQLVVTFVDADHHNETWGYGSNGKIQTHTFFLTRAKASVKQ